MPKKSDSPPTAKVHVQVPRTFSAAKKAGYPITDFKFADLSDEHKASFVMFSDLGAKSGHVCGVGPSTTPGCWSVCYKGPSGKCNWVDVPKGDPIEDHE